MSSAFAGVWDTHNNPTPSKAGVCGAWSARALAFQTRTSAAASFMSTMSNGSAITALQWEKHNAWNISALNLAWITTLQ